MNPKKKGKNVAFAAVFNNTTIHRALSLKTSIYTAKMSAIRIALKRIKQKREQNWTVHTNSESSVKTIWTEKSQFSILNKIYDVAAELQEQGKQIMYEKYQATIKMVPEYYNLKNSKDQKIPNGRKVS